MRWPWMPLPVTPRAILALALAVATLGVSLAALGARGKAEALVFESDRIEIKGVPVDGKFVFQFVFTNTGPEAVTVESVRTSCGCTVAEVPELPWTLAPGERGEFAVAMDVRGRRGSMSKSVYLNTTAGTKPLSVRGTIERAPGTTEMDDRTRNMEIALADRAAIFKGDCASCHATPAVGKMGAPLYLAACAICHESENRASVVPDLRALPHPTDRDHWLRWISFGRHGSLMPAFSAAEGGLLSEEQIDSLADYLTRTISKAPAGARAAASEAGPGHSSRAGTPGAGH